MPDAAEGEAERGGDDDEVGVGAAGAAVMPI